MRSDKLIIGLAILLIFGSYTVLVFGFLNAVGESRLLYLGLIGLPLSIGLFMAPRISLLLLGVLVYSIDWISDVWHAIPREATWLIDILVLLLIARTALFAIQRKEPLPAVEKWIYLLFAFAVLSAVLNGLGRATMFVGFRVAFRYLGLFVAAYYLAPSRQWFHGYLRYLFAIGLIQVPVILIQFNVYGWNDPDELAGTFGQSQTSAVGLFLLTLTVYMCSRMMEERRFRPSYVLIILIMMIAPVLGEVKFYFLIMPLLLAFMIRSEFFRRPALAIGMSLAVAVLFVGVDFVILSSGGWAEGRNPLTYIQRLPEVFSSELEPVDETRIERSFMYANAIRLAARSPHEILLGNGPGSVTHSVVAEGHSPKIEFFEQWGLSSNAVSVPFLLIEFGYLGTGILFMILWQIFRRGRVLRASEDVELRAYGRTLETVTFLYVCWLFYSPAWQSDSMNFIYWPLAAFLVYLSYHMKPQTQDEDEDILELTSDRTAVRTSLIPETTAHR